MDDPRDDVRSAAADADSSAAPAKAPRPADEVGAPYRVLARKYRPARFEDLIGQEAMVRTLSNAFALGRVHQAYLLTGVRGVGKTTTARILARAFNFEREAKDGFPAVSRPTIELDPPGVHCQAIMESRHVDVVEMDAASHTGVDDVREIIEGARYSPVLARFKVYIIDEVHMLSKSAFNALLKTLEEPPDHVKFLFATTEVEKVPVTVRSRCQRFDLRRVEPGALAAHLASICASENVFAEEEALAVLARAAEGSVRDALSLLDQAIAHGGGEAGGVEVSAESVRAMLGVADRGRVVDLFEDVMGGRIAPALASLKALYDDGADPAGIVLELAEFAHLVTRMKIVPSAAEDASVTPVERRRGVELAQALSMAVLTRAWQLLSKGLAEVRESPRPLAAADMVLVRLAYAADLPTPEETLRRLGSGAASPRPAPAQDAGPSEGARAQGSALAAQAPRARPVAAAPAPASAPDDAPRLARFEEVVALAAARRDIQLKLALERDVRLVRFEEGSIEFAPGPDASPQLAQTLMRRLQEWTGRRWIVAVSNEEGSATLKERADAQAAREMEGVMADPAVRRALELFPGAEITVRPKEEREPPAASGADAMEDDIGFPDEIDGEPDF